MQKIDVKALIEKHSTQEETKPLEKMTREEFETSGKVLKCITDSGREVYIPSSQELMKQYLKDGKTCFLPVEVEKLKGKSPEIIEKVIDTKEIFPGTKTIQ